MIVVIKDLQLHKYLPYHTIYRIANLQKYRLSNSSLYSSSNQFKYSFLSTILLTFKPIVFCFCDKVSQQVTATSTQPPAVTPPQHFTRSYPLRSLNKRKTISAFGVLFKFRGDELFYVDHIEDCMLAQEAITLPLGEDFTNVCYCFPSLFFAQQPTACAWHDAVRKCRSQQRGRKDPNSRQIVTPIFLRICRRASCRGPPCVGEAARHMSEWPVRLVC